ncbi:butyrophilin subfamily 1 member A1 [Aulostomus maculatus]
MIMDPSFILFWLVTGVFFSAEEAAFIELRCKTDNQGRHGQQSMVECVIKTSEEVQAPEIRIAVWKKGSTKLLLFQDGKFTDHEPRHSFAEPRWNQTNMNVSLLITNTAVADGGNYSCFVITTSGESSSSGNLAVTAKYNKPIIHISPKKFDGNVNLSCSSDGGYPEGQLHWFYKDTLQSSQMKVARTGNDLFNLSSELKVRGSDVSEYSCSVSSGSNDKVVTRVEVPGGVEPVTQTKNDLASKIAAAVVVIGSLVVGLLILLIYKRRCRRGREPVFIQTRVSDAEEPEDDMVPEP